MRNRNKQQLVKNIMVAYEYGVDLNSNFDFKDGDLTLSEYDDNLIQSIKNRLNTDYDCLDIFYEDYGSVLSQFLGWRRNDETLSFIRLELEDCLGKDPRITDYELELDYNDNGNVVIQFTITGETDLSFNLVLGIDGVELEETDEYDIEE